MNNPVTQLAEDTASAAVTLQTDAAERLAGFLTVPIHLAAGAVIPFAVGYLVSPYAYVPLTKWSPWATNLMCFGCWIPPFLLLANLTMPRVRSQNGFTVALLGLGFCWPFLRCFFE